MGLFNWMFRTVYGSRMKPFEGLPGPEPCFPLGNTLAFRGKMKRPWEVCAAFGRKYGGMCVFWMFGEPVVLLNDPALIRQVMIDDRLKYYKDSPCPELLPVLTDSSPNINNGAEWQRKREISPFMQEYAVHWRRAQVEGVRNWLRAGAEKFAASSSGGAVALQPFLQRLTFEAFALGAVGNTLDDATYDDFMTMATQGSHRMLSGMPYGKDLDRHGRAARERWHARFQKSIDEARAGADPDRNDLVSIVIRHGVPFDDASFAAELGNIFFGGDFSVPSALTNAMYYLTQNPDTMAALREALDGIGPDFDHDALEGCAYLDAVVREGLRIRSSVPLWDRRVQKDTPTTLNGVELPGNTHVFILNWLLHWDETRWPEPDQFKPERWLDGVAEANPYGSDYFFPLGRGPRICLGIDYAVFYMKLLLATWVGGFDIECGKGQAYDDGQRYFFGVRMPWGLKATVRPRT